MTVDALPDDVDIPVREQIESVSFTLRTRLRRRTTARRSPPLLQMVDRAEFDLALDARHRTAEPCSGRRRWSGR